MYIDSEHEEFDNIVILFNGKVINAVAADDQDGWVDIVDLTKLAPLPDFDSIKQGKTEDHMFNTPGEEVELAEWEELPLKRLFGEVKIVNVKESFGQSASKVE